MKKVIKTTNVEQVVPTNASKLTNMLMDTLTKVVNGKADPKVAQTLSTGTNAAIKIVKAQMQYNKDKNYKAKISFLESK